MITILVIIYLAFISLGLPDSIFGVAWPTAHIELGADESIASFYSIITGVCSGLSSALSGPLIRRFGTPVVTCVSILLTVVGLTGISFSPNIVVMMLFAMVMGFGAGAIDTGLNNYVSLHYKASHMNWLHAFWGVGVTVSPLIMSYFLSENHGGWRFGYRTIALVQLVIVAITFAFLKKWRSFDKVVAPAKGEPGEKRKQKPPILRQKGLIASILAMGSYTAMEFIVMTWGGTYFVKVFAADPDVASRWVSFYFAGIMAGRMLCGFLAMKFSDNTMIRFGMGFSLLGMALLLIDLSFAPYIGFLLIGLGFAPVFPCIIHLVPRRFGEEFSADYTGYTMGGGYAIGYTSSLIFGFAASRITFFILPFVLMAFAVLVLVFNEAASRQSSKILLREGA